MRKSYRRTGPPTSGSQFVRGTITRVKQAKVLKLQVHGRQGERFEQAEMFQFFGFRSHPINGAEAIVIRVGGHGIVIGTEDRRYPCPVQTKPGDTVGYNAQGDYLHISNDRVMTLNLAGNEIQITEDEMIIHHAKKIKLATPAFEVYTDDWESPVYASFQQEGA